MSTSPAQQFLAVDSIREDAVVLKDGGFRVVLMCSSLNFALKSPDEQDAIIFQYQNFLNALDFPLEFVIHSRRLNIAPYLESLQERQREEGNELLKVQINEYIEFVKTFVDMTNIMSKTFYVVVPFTPAIIKQEGILNSLGSILGLVKKRSSEQNATFEEYKNQIWQRVDTVAAGLQRFGVRSTPLNTEELIELFYGLYNPTEFEKTTAIER
ncbi:MAG: hypothetical protein G01um101433_789 [Parcubacteria group bacterium Gr01-1014_33]|nr:MAG: hypothetical protein G01um101433_789 [Parcubacteria group bacterium Gr01-1014_33]